MGDNAQIVCCPFCNEQGFDLVGLKHHLLNGWCAVSNKTESVEAERKVGE